MRPVLAACLALALAAAAPPPTPDAAALERGLAGRWAGTLSYRDYQSNKLEEIPLRTEITALPDGVTVLRVATFDDGPKVGDVTITTASLYDPKAGTVTSATLRKGNALETGTERLRVTAFTDATHWTIVAEEDGSDDDKPALLRVTEVRDGDTLTATKEVQPKPGDGKWQFRNRTLLRRNAAQ
ncbi:hypothetical protein IP88_11230 [alpha proteobacterium AAP81b]|nr:hypothetical protein IP88_11230 [alpha proteobacterium AAP81b]